MNSANIWSKIDRRRLALASVAVLLTIAVLWFTNRAAIPPEAKWEDVLVEAKSGGYSLINTEERRKLYEQEPRTKRNEKGEIMLKIRFFMNEPKGRP